MERDYYNRDRARGRDERGGRDDGHQRGHHYRDRDDRSRRDTHERHSRQDYDHKRTQGEHHEGGEERRVRPRDGGSERHRDLDSRLGARAERAPAEALPGLAFPEDLRSYEHTFVLSPGIPQQLVHGHLQKVMASYGLREVPITQRGIRPVFVWAELRNKQFDRRLYAVHCGLKNLLSNDKYEICRKDRLSAQLVARGAGNFLAETFPCTNEAQPLPISSLPTPGPEDVFIFRPVQAFGGNGITIIRAPTPEQIRDAVERGREAAMRIKHKATDVLMSRYCTTPLLWKRHKCHFRAYFLVTVLRGVVRAYLWEEGKIYTAGKPYVNDHFDDHGIHDSHCKSTEGDPVFPADLAAGGVPDHIYPIARAQMIEALQHVAAIYLPHAKAFDECAYGFEVFGADFLVRDDGSVLLLEMNEKVCVCV
jgi:hypothetical protein